MNRMTAFHPYEKAGMNKPPFPPLQQARDLIGEWLASVGSEPAGVYDDDAKEILYYLADAGLTVVTCDPNVAYKGVHATNRKA